MDPARQPPIPLMAHANDTRALHASPSSSSPSREQVSYRFFPLAAPSLAIIYHGSPPRADPNPNPSPPARSTVLPAAPTCALGQGGADRDRPLRGLCLLLLVRRRGRLPGGGDGDAAPERRHPRRHGASGRSGVAPLCAGRFVLGAADAAAARGVRSRRHGRIQRERRRGYVGYGEGRRGQGYADERGGDVLHHAAGLAVRGVFRRRETLASSEEVKERCYSN